MYTGITKLLYIQSTLYSWFCFDGLLQDFSNSIVLAINFSPIF